MFVIEPSLLIYDDKMKLHSLDEKIKATYFMLEKFKENKAINQISMSTKYLELINNSAPINQHQFDPGPYSRSIRLYLMKILTTLEHNIKEDNSFEYENYICNENFIRSYMLEYSKDVEESLVSCFLQEVKKIVTDDDLGEKKIEANIDAEIKIMECVHSPKLNNKSFPFFYPSPKHSYKTSHNRGGRKGQIVSILVKEDEEACCELIKSSVIYNSVEKNIKDRFAYNKKTNTYLRFVTTDNKTEYHAFPEDESFFQNKMALKKEIDEKFK